MDGLTATYSLTDDLPGSYWLGELGRPFVMERIEVVNRSTPDAVELAGLTLSVMNMDDLVSTMAGKVLREMSG